MEVDDSSLNISMEPFPNACKYLWMDFNLKTGQGRYTCTCQESTCAGCLKDGWCPIYPILGEMIKKSAEEFFKTKEVNG